MDIPREPLLGRAGTWKSFAAVVATLALTACQPGSSGTMEPAGGQPEGPADPYGYRTVSIPRGAVRIDVSGGWTERLGENTLDIRVTYANFSASTVSIDASRIRAVRGMDTAMALETVDTTPTHRGDPGAGPDEALRLHDGYTGGPRRPLRLRPRETRIVESTLGFADGTGTLSSGQRVTVTVPADGRAVVARFNTAGGGWF